MEKLCNREMMRTITLEEHYATPAFLDGPGRKLNEQAQMAKHFGYGNLIEELSDLGDNRIAEMDFAGIDVQVLSLTSPSVQQLEATEAVELTREANDYLAEAMQRYPKRLAGFATLPTADPNIAAEELERMVNEHASEEEISTATHEAATWMTNSFGRSWSGPKRSRFHFTSIQHYHRNQ